MLTSKDVALASFTATKWREGYDQERAIDYLDQIVAALRQHEFTAES